MKNIGKVIIALLAGILFPILVWIALGVVINQKLRGKKIVTIPTIARVLEAVQNQ